jgi:hypothetical protein
MINDNTLLNSNEAAPSTPSAQPTPTLPLSSLQEILHNRIIQKKGEIHEPHNRVYNDNLWREIETLQWVLAQILTLRRRGYNSNNNNKIIDEIINSHDKGCICNC